MRSRINGALGLMLMLAMAFGFTAVGPTAVLAQEETGACQYAVSGDGEVSISAAGIGLTEDECRAYLEAEFGTLGTEPGAACQITLVNGEVTTSQGTCQAPEETPTEVPATEVPATEVPATEVPATEVPATEVPATEVPAAPVDEEDDMDEPAAPADDDTDEPAAEVVALPSTGSGMSDGAGLLTVAAVAAAALSGAGALTIRNKR